MGVSRPKPTPRNLKIIIFIFLILLPFGVLKYYIDNDISNHPPRSENKFMLPNENGTFFEIELGRLPVLSNIFFRLSRNEINSNIIIKGYVMLEYQFQKYRKGIVDYRSNPIWAILNKPSSYFWLNMTTVDITNYHIVIATEGEGEPVGLDLRVSVNIPNLWKRATYSIIFTISAYYILTSIFVNFFTKYRIKRFHKTRQTALKMEEEEYEKKKRKNNVS